jgi:hypothetical protein
MANKIRLREKDIQKISVLLKLPIDILQELNAKKLLDDTEVRDLLILSDWKKIRKRKNFTASQITEALMNEYQVSKSKIENIIYIKKKAQHYCTQCQKRIPKSEYKRNNGFCDRCIALSIKL